MSEIEIILALLVAVAALAALAARLRLPYPILLVLGGIGLGVVPGLPPIRLDPEAVFLVFVPPLVFSAAFFTSWRDFATNLRPILSLAVGLVLASTFAVAAVSHLVIGIDWAPALVLGAVVSNTDTTAIVAIAQQVGLPRRLMTILEGESLANDAVGLTAFRLAVAATVSGAASPWAAGGDFALAVLGGLIVGLAAGWLTATARTRSHDPRIVVIISLVTPYAAYLPADGIGGSGILAVVVAGLYVGRRESRIEDAATRLQARAVWDALVFGLNGLLFILVGVQLRSTWSALRGYPVEQLVAAGAAVSLTVIVARISWVALAALLPHGLRPGQRAGRAILDRRDAAVVAWAGLRGGDTLAAALSVPLVIAGGAPFPARAEIVFLAFVVIVVTLVGQGLTLPALIRTLGVVGDGSEEREVRLARQTAVGAALGRLEELSQAGDLSPELATSLRSLYRRKAEKLGAAGAAAEAAGRSLGRERQARQEIVRSEREALLRLRDERAISDQVLRRVERDLDLEEARLTR